MRLVSASLLATAALLTACGPEYVDCSLEARSSVQVTVVDSRGRPQRDARVTFTLEGGPEQQALCNGGRSTPGDCDAWVTAYEQPGSYVVTATSADGTRSTRQDVTVQKDTCHVLTETVTLTLPD